VLTKEPLSVSIGGQSIEVRLAYLFDETAVIATVSGPAQVLPGHQVRRSMLEFRRASLHLFLNPLLVKVGVHIL
jgi:hypothetical protein